MTYKLIEAEYSQEVIKRIRLGIIISEYNENMSEKLLEGCLQRLNELGILSEHVTVVKVPGAIEIPLATQFMAKHSEVHGLIALGAVVRGETSHYDYVCQQVSHGCQQVMLHYSVPVVFAVLTVDNAQQAFERLGGKEGHKGIEAADTAVAMVSIVSQLD